MMQLFFEMFGLLLLLPRARRALARAETRAHTAAAHARALRRPQARVWPMCRVLLYVWTRAPSRMACSMSRAGTIRRMACPLSVFQH